MPMLLEAADELIAVASTHPEQVDVGTLRQVYTRLHSASVDDEDETAGQKAWELKQAMRPHGVELAARAARPLLDAIKTRLQVALGGLPATLSDLERWPFVPGEGISGGVAVGVGQIVFTPTAATELLLDGGLEFTVAHELAHVIKGALSEPVWSRLMRTDAQIQDAGVDIAGSNPAKLEEVRADVYGAETLAAYLGVPVAQLPGSSIAPAISAPQDAEHPTEEERIGMLTALLEISFTGPA